MTKDWFRPLRQIEGIGGLIAATFVAEFGRPRPGFADEQLAALSGAAPVEVSSAGTTRHRLNRGGNRRLNLAAAAVAVIESALVFQDECALHRIVFTQRRIYPLARAYLLRRQAEGKTGREARRALKRLICRRIVQAWRACLESPLAVAARSA